MHQLELSENDIRMLVQSLDHCLATCHAETKSGGAVCSDCEAAKVLRKRLLTELPA